MKFCWRTNRFALFGLFLLTAFWALIKPQTALRIVDYYGKGREAELEKRFDDLSK